MGLKARPDFRIAIGDQDLTARVRDRMSSLAVTDNSGEESDQLEIVLDDRGNAIESPRRGAVLSVSIGYVGDGLYHMGRFTVDEVEPQGPPDLLIIRAKAADMREGFKAQRSRAFRQTTIGAIVAGIAAEHGLTAATAPALAGIAIPHRDQSNESDLHFLTRLGRDFGAVAAPKDGKLLFVPVSTGVTASGASLDVVTLARADLTRWRGISADRESQGAVRARYRDAGAGRTRFATAGSGQPVKTLRSLYRDQATAKAAAEADLMRAKGASNGVELTLPGRPSILAQTPIEISGLRADLSGRWIARTVQHVIDFGGDGFNTTITAAKAT